MIIQNNKSFRNEDNYVCFFCKRKKEALELAKSTSFDENYCDFEKISKF